ncbi:cation:proton antiporter [Brochothrix campestris]|uniref:Potassium efflux system protein n=1 Tax=Brochothrix campestris FSL F6-1037 TaxID=1265861 RepID=W7CJE9_9LIST|nr:cation:proton antiporter [Brochothrix campestris]EUJ35971.1 potassium efflux system protein [Brochothrix campestris FSL F6-1037]
MELLWQLALIIVAAKSVGYLSQRLGQPSVLGEIIVGILIGPAVFGWLTFSHSLETFSELGVIFLMFFAGLETNMKDLRDNQKSAITVAVLGVIAPFIGGYLVGYLMGLSLTHSLFIGIVFSATSVSISVQTFRELNVLKSRESITVLGAAVVDDVLVIVGLAVMLSLTVADDMSLSLVFIKQLVFFIVIILISWKIVPLIARLFSKSNDAFIVFAAILCLSFSYFADAMGLSNIIGAFIAGLALSGIKQKVVVEEKFAPAIFTLFVPVFFVGIGLSVDFTGIGSHLLLLLLLTVVAIITKLVGAAIGARVTGFDTRGSLIIGAAMISRGEVALITASLGLSAGLISQSYFTPIIVAVIITTLVTPPLLKALIKPA